ncbi:unnamed protein product, partial [Heterosigma akashiwo]
LLSSGPFVLLYKKTYILMRSLYVQEDGQLGHFVGLPRRPATKNKKVQQKNVVYNNINNNISSCEQSEVFSDDGETKRSLAFRVKKDHNRQSVEAAKTSLFLDDRRGKNDNNTGLPPAHRSETTGFSHHCW